MEKNNRYLIKPVLITLLAAALLIGGVLAWFTDAETVQDTIRMGTVIITVSGADSGQPVMTFQTDGALPGDMIYEGGKIEITNTGTADVYLRVEIKETWLGIDDEDEAYIITESLDRTLDSVLWGKYQAVMGNWQNWTGPTLKGLEDWAFHEGYWYYMNLNAGETNIEPYKNTDPAIVFLPDGIKIKLAETADDTYQGATYQLVLTFEAVQYKNLADSDIATAAALAGIWP